MRGSRGPAGGICSRGTSVRCAVGIAVKSRITNANKTTMNKDNAAQFLPLVQALAEGKEIQFKSQFDEKWSDFRPGCNWSFEGRPECFRIKPSPKLRAWTSSEVPLGAWLRSIGQTERCSLIVSKGPRTIAAIRSNAGMSDIAISDLLDIAEHSTDNGKTWQPCGVLES